MRVFCNNIVDICNYFVVFIESIIIILIYYHLNLFKKVDFLKNFLPYKPNDAGQSAALTRSIIIL